jgi:hypothetical protein
MHIGMGIGVGLGTQARSGYSPADVFGASLALWADTADLSRLYQDSAGTTPVTAAGQPVGRIVDRSGNGRHLIQATSGNRPTLVAHGTLFGASFDGSNDWLYASSAVTLGEYSLVMRTKFDFANGYLWHLEAGANDDYSYRPTGYTLRVHRGTSRTFDLAGAWASLGTYARYATIVRAASPYAQFYRDGVSQGSITLDPGTGTKSCTLHVHADNAGTYRAQATMTEVLLISRAITNGELADLDTYLSEKWA